MKPRPHASHKARVVVYFDANMPEVRGCHRGCVSERAFMCRHRFGPRIWFVAKTVGLNRMKDLEVIADFLATIRKHWTDRKGIPQKKHWVLATHDEGFLTDAKGQYRRMVANGLWAGPVLEFGAGWVRSGEGKQAITIRMFQVPQNLGGKDRDLQAVLAHCRELRRTAP